MTCQAETCVESRQKVKSFRKYLKDEKMETSRLLVENHELSTDLKKAQAEIKSLEVTNAGLVRLTESLQSQNRAHRLGQPAERSNERNSNKDEIQELKETCQIFSQELQRKKLENRRSSSIQNRC